MWVEALHDRRAAETPRKATPVGDLPDRALVAFDELDQEDRIAILSVFDGRPLDAVSMQVNLLRDMPDLPPSTAIQRPDGAAGELLTRIEEVLRLIGGTPGDDNREQSKLRQVLATALVSRFPGSRMERPELPMFVTGTHGAEVMVRIEAVVTEFDALSDTERRRLRPWLEDGLLVYVTTETPLKDNQN